MKLDLKMIITYEGIIHVEAPDDKIDGYINDVILRDKISLNGFTMVSTYNDADCSAYGERFNIVGQICEIKKGDVGE